MSPVPYSTDFASAANGALRSGNGEKALAIATITGATMPSIIWSYSMVKPRTSPSRICARTEKVLQALHAADDEIVAVQRARIRPCASPAPSSPARTARRGPSVLDAEGLDLHFAMRRGPARAARGVARHAAPAWSAGRCACRSPDRPPRSSRIPARDPCAAATRLARSCRRERAGDFGLAALLEILDRGEHRVVAARRAGIVARPQQRRLDRQPLVGGNAGERVGRGLRLWRVGLRRLGPWRRLVGLPRASAFLTMAGLPAAAWPRRRAWPRGFAVGAAVALGVPGRGRAIAAPAPATAPNASTKHHQQRDANALLLTPP